MLTPAVAMMPRMPTPLAMKARPARRARVKTSAPSGPTMPSTGAAIIQECAL